MKLERIVAILSISALAALVGGVVGSAEPANAASNTIVAPDTAGSVGLYTSLALDASGNPVVSYWDVSNNDLKLLHCGNPTCTSGNTIASPDTVGFVGLYTSLALDGSGNPVVSYLDSNFFDLKLLHCGNPTCTSDNTVVSPDTAGFVGWDTSLALDTNGNPVVSYFDNTNGDLKVLHCNDPYCTGNDESITSPDTGGTHAVGLDSSLVLDSTGNPVVSYSDATSWDLKVLRCNDPNCADGDESITAPDTAGMVGFNTSLALDANGNPVVSYYDATFDTKDLRVLHCGNPTCTSDNSITSPDTAGIVGLDGTSLALDANGNPAVSYFDATNGDLKLLHCNDPNCSGNGETIFSPDTGGTDNVGQFQSLALDGNSNPVISYHDGTNRDLKVLHCDNAFCIEGVGGIAELPDIAGTTPPLQESDSSSVRVGLLAIIGAITVGSLALASAAWYTRRRWSHRSPRAELARWGGRR